MLWNLYSIYTLVTTLLNVLRYTSSSPLNSIDYVNSNDPSKFDNINDEGLLVYDTLPVIPTSIDSSSSSSSSPSSSVLLPTSPTSLPISSSIPNEEEETLRLQLALALQIDSELNKAMNLENAASESIQQANLLNKEANEAKYRAQIAEHMLNSLKQLWNIINNNNDDDDNTSYEKRGFIKVPKINQDYLLDEEVGGQLIDTGHDDDNREKRNQEHRERHHHHQRYYNMKKRRNLYSISDYPNHEDDADDDDDKNMILNDSEPTIEKLHRTKQLTLEKIRLLILRQLIKQQRKAEEEEEEQEKDKGRTGDEHQRDLHHYDHPHGNNNNDIHYDLQLDRNDIPLQMMNPYPNLYDSLQTWKEKDNDDDDDDSNGINIDMNERNRHGIIKHHPWKSLSHLNSLDKDDSIVFR
uniref:Myb domain-containing protein n=1 Tax=Schistosoma mansoni TaxID=6183 RepID=A0A3Q0KHA3_SCHMA